jgi:restriction system protein
MRNNMWKVHAGRGSANVNDFLENGVVAIGWEQIGEVTPGTAKEQIVGRYAELAPHKTKNQLASGAGQVVRFLDEIQVGDRVITYDAEKRIYYLGEITSPPRWEPGLVDRLPRVRDVNWSRQVSRDKLTVAARNTLGAIMTLFNVREEVAAELEAKAVPLGQEEPHDIPPETPEEDEALEEVSAELVQKAMDFIEDHIAALEWHEMQELVAGVLRGMGYRTTVSQPGRDRGFDIFASPDGLGLQEPRIYVEVKHRPSTAIGAPAIRSFLGGRKPKDSCLYVSTGGFSNEAHYEADRATVPLKLLTLPDLARLVVEHYDKLDESTRALVPLQRVYVLAD